MAKMIANEDLDPGVNPLGSKSHLIGGYTSSYYSYLWSQVYSSDLFAQFEEKGLFNKELGMKYRKIILAPGGSRDSMDSLLHFLGRTPND